MNTLVAYSSIPGAARVQDPPTSTLTLLPASARVLGLARAWLWLGLAALVLSGLYSILLVLARTPGINAWLPAGDFFRVALVVHVDLSVLVWFVACAGMLWTLNLRDRALGLARTALGLSALGTLIMAAAPFVAPASPVMANYIPVLDGPVFLAGLVLFGVGAALLITHGLLAAPTLGPGLGMEGAIRFGLNASVIAAAVAVLAFAASVWLTPRVDDARMYYEILFWGGGHALQFAWTLLMLVAWVWLAFATGMALPISARVLVVLLLLALLSVFVTPLAYLVAPVESVLHRDLHTWGMRFGGGLAILPISLAVVMAWIRAGRAHSATMAPLRSALLASMALFAAGGLIGVVIQGNNVRIPAHYHGCIVGVTLALMGLVYLLLPRFGLASPSGRLARWQPLIYGLGQLLHIIGLVWSGGYGVQRKVAGAEQVLRTPSEMAGMGLMGLGGLIAIVGGLLFVVVVWQAFRARRPGSVPA